MTRKDYVMIAEILKANREDFVQGDEGLSLLYILSHQIANGLEEDNPRFDRARFLTACGVN
jgi:hypothetical protein